MKKGSHASGVGVHEQAMYIPLVDFFRGVDFDCKRNVILTGDFEIVPDVISGGGVAVGGLNGVIVEGLELECNREAVERVGSF